MVGKDFESMHTICFKLAMMTGRLYLMHHHENGCAGLSAIASNSQFHLIA
jgi:hypothetical protein